MSPSALPYRYTPTDDDFARARASIAPLQKALSSCRARLGSASMTIAWMSDLHLHAPRPHEGNLGFYGDRVDCSANFRLALAELGALAPLPDLLVLGGDMADGGCGGEAPADEYVELGCVLRDSLPADLPTLAIPGNHDHADQPLSAAWHKAFHAAAPHPWPASPDADDYYFTHCLGGWRFIALDSRQNGQLSKRQRTWLDDELARDTVTPTLVLVHRPFLTVGNWVDDFRLQDRPVFDLLDASPAVKAVWSGHTHLPRAWRYRGKKHVVFPSLAYGIPGPCGWGVGVFGRHQLEALFIKPAANPWFDNVGGTMRRSTRPIERLPFRSYTADLRFNPCLLPKEVQRL